MLIASSFYEGLLLPYGYISFNATSAYDTSQVVLFLLQVH